MAEIQPVRFPLVDTISYDDTSPVKETQLEQRRFGVCRLGVVLVALVTVLAGLAHQALKYIESFLDSAS